MDSDRTGQIELLTRVVELLRWANAAGWQVRSLQTSDFEGSEFVGIEIWRKALLHEPLPDQQVDGEKSREDLNPTLQLPDQEGGG